MKPCCLTFAVNVKKQPEAIKSCGLNKHGIILTVREGVRQVESIKVMLMKPSEYTRLKSNRKVKKSQGFLRSNVHKASSKGSNFN